MSSNTHPDARTVEDCARSLALDVILYVQKQAPEKPPTETHAHMRALINILLDSHENELTELAQEFAKATRPNLIAENLPTLARNVFNLHEDQLPTWGSILVFYTFVALLARHYQNVQREALGSDGCNACQRRQVQENLICEVGKVMGWKTTLEFLRSQGGWKSLEGYYDRVEAKKRGLTKEAWAALLSLSVAMTCFFVFVALK